MKRSEWRFTGTALFLCFLFPAALRSQTEIALNPFDGISVAGGIEVVLEQGDVEQLSLYVEGIPEDEVSVKISRGELKIKVLNSFLYRDEVIRAYVTYRQLRSIRAHAGAQITSESTVSGDQLEVRATSGAKVELAIQANALEGGATEGGRLDLSGKVNSQRASASTGGQYFARELDCQRSYVKAGTGGIVEVVAKELLEASANMGGEIHYLGDPASKTIKTVLAGEVSKLDL